MSLQRRKRKKRKRPKAATTAPNITRRAGERATRAEAGVEAEGGGAEVGVGVEEAGEGGVAAGEHSSQVNQCLKQFKEYPYNKFCKQQEQKQE